GAPLADVDFASDAFATGRPLIQPHVRAVDRKVQLQLSLPDASTATELAMAARPLGPKSLASMPAPTQNFDGLARTDLCGGVQCGTRDAPDTNGDVGPNHYVQAVNQAYAIYDKSGNLQSAFTEDQLWSTSPNTICKTQSRGDPVVLYDAIADRWILTHIAYALSGNDPVAPFYQCIAASISGDPSAGNYFLYPIPLDDPSHPWVHRYAKFGIWTDCLYMAANEYGATGTSPPFQGTLFATFSRADMYAGLGLHYAIGFITNTTDPFTMLPSNLSGQAALGVPAGTPNFYVSQSQTANSFEVRKFTPGANCGDGGLLSAPVSVTQTAYVEPAGVPQPGVASLLDDQGDRLMQKNQYRKVGAQESLWVAHTVVPTASNPSGIQWAQIDVTGGVIATTPVQQQVFAPDSTLYRWLPSLAVDHQGDMAIGYSTSNGVAPNYPGLSYAGRLVSDPANTLGQGEAQLIAGGGSQTGNCGGVPCPRWGGYASMSVDPVDDCTFWFTSQYVASPTDGAAVPPVWRTRIGAFKFAACSPVARQADLSVTNSDGLTTVTAGKPIRYTVVVTNNGAFAVSGASLVDTLPSGITGVSWTCTSTPASSCPASGGGSINTAAINLQPGATATFVISGTVSPGASGTLTTVATVAVPSGIVDPVGANDSATDMTSVVPPAAGTLYVSRAGSGDGAVSSTDAQIDCGLTCAHAYAGGATTTLTVTPAAGSIFTGWSGACTGTAPCNVFIDGDQSVTATFAPSSVGNRTLDVDNNNAYDALTDGLLVLRALFGFTGDALTSAALGNNALRMDALDVSTYLNDVRPRLDVDGNGQSDPLTDGLLIVRYLAGLRGPALIQGVIGPGATRTGALQIEVYLQTLKP
ncbi:MAG: hypothetical protein ABI748_14070, partial [Dokdonella sp.]